ncbi:MAG: hypothetical protein HOQ12_14250 [Gemmatimonadaceae bacterium]|nr:hypothetical protein [Gemmatimonadaceae bacterium]
MTMPVDRAAWGTTDPRPAARLLAWISAGLAAAPAVGAALARGPHFTPRSSLLAIAALAGLPHGYLALRLTRHRPTDRFTLDLGAGVVRATRFALVLLALYPVLAILLLLGFGPLFPLLVLEQHMADGFGSSAAMLLWGIVLFTIQWRLARALRAIMADSGGRAATGALTGSLGPLALAVLFVTGLAITHHADSAAAHELEERIPVPHSRAIAAADRVMEEVHRCAELYATAHAGTYPDSLPGLWSDQPRCRAAAFDLARSQGIDLRYRAHHRDSAGAAHGFDLVARVDSAHDDLRYALLTDESAIDLTPAPGAVWPGSAAWPDSTVLLRPATRMAQLVLDEAERVNRMCWDPGQSAYPTDPSTVGRNTPGPSCSWGPTPAILDGRVYDLKYVSADTSGQWTRGFAISARPRTYGYDGFRSYLLVFRGLDRTAVYATAANRPATASDPIAPQCELAHGGVCRLRR